MTYLDPNLALNKNIFPYFCCVLYFQHSTFCLKYQKKTKIKGFNKAAVDLYFKFIGNETFECKSCHKIRQQSNKKGFSNLISHLETGHPKDWGNTITAFMQKRNQNTTTQNRNIREILGHSAKTINFFNWVE